MNKDEFDKAFENAVDWRPDLTPEDQVKVDEAAARYSAGAAEYRQLREAAGLSQLEMAGLLGMTQAGVSHRETNTRRVPAVEALLLRYMARYGRPEVALDGGIISDLTTEKPNG